MSREIPNIKMENIRLVFRNFSGKPDKFNPQGGKRGFSVVIDDPEYAQDLIEEGWNVKKFNKRDEDEEDTYYLPVKVNFNNNPPHIYLCTDKSKKALNEETVCSLDYADISGTDIIITPYEYKDIGGRSGISAYVKTMYVNVVLDDFAAKYEDSEEVPFE